MLSSVSKVSFYVGSEVLSAMPCAIVVSHQKALSHDFVSCHSISISFWQNLKSFCA